MSLPSSSNPPALPVAPKQRFNVYTMMLILSFLAIATACVLLYTELSRYGKYPWWDTSEANVPATSMLLPDAGMHWPQDRARA